MRQIVTLLLATILLCSAAADASDDLYAPHAAALMEKSTPPVDYVVGKFDSVDVVLLGEDHAIRQTLEFVESLVPRLYQAGVRNLVMEFGAVEDQQELDRLLTAPVYDRAKAKRLMFHYNSAWSWIEYQRLYEAAWRFNLTLPQGQPPFRVVNMSYVYRWDRFASPRSLPVLRRVFWRGTIDGFRAGLIEAEILARREKALVLTGTPHAFSRYAMPMMDDNADEFCRFDDNWLGNRLLRRHPGKVLSILMHQPFPSMPGRDSTHEQPALGAIETVMAALGNEARGFDLRNEVIGTLPDRSAYSMCREDFVLADFFDGYVFLAPIGRLQPATPDLAFVDEGNLSEAIRQFPDPDWKPRPADLAAFRAHLSGMENEIRQRYGSVD